MRCVKNKRKTRRLKVGKVRLNLLLRELAGLLFVFCRNLTIDERWTVEGGREACNVGGKTDAVTKWITMKYKIYEVRIYLLLRAQDEHFISCRIIEAEGYETQVNGLKRSSWQVAETAKHRRRQKEGGILVHQPWKIGLVKETCGKARCSVKLISHESSCIRKILFKSVYVKSGINGMKPKLLCVNGDKMGTNLGDGRQTAWNGS